MSKNMYHSQVKLDGELKEQGQAEYNKLNNSGSIRWLRAHRFVMALVGSQLSY